MAASVQLVVAHHRPDLLYFFRSWFTDEEEAGNIEIIHDGRIGDRRQRVEPCEEDVRRGERRRQSEIADDLEAVGWALVSRS